jgi:homoisocitrate dehydrogenase
MGASAIPPLHVLTIPGDGIGVEVVPAAVEVLRATGLPFEFVAADAGWSCFERRGTSLPDETLAAAWAADAILFGAVASPSHPVDGYRSPIVALRRKLDLYANIRPVQADERPTTNDQRHDSRFSVLDSRKVDLVVVRENTEGLYAGQESSDGETAVAQRVITRRASERIVRRAFELARSRQLSVVSSPLSIGVGDELRTRDNGQRTRRPRVTIVHKANILRETCGLFRSVGLRVAEQYPDIAVDELLVDSAALQLVQRPERFDVIVTTNLFGDILSDVASYWGGGLGMATSANVGERHALFEPVHGAAPDIAGKGIANPLAAIGCAAMLLEYLGRRPAPGPESASPERDAGQHALSAACLEWAGRVRAAIRATIADGTCTPDLGGAARTAEVTAAVIAALTT